jgi:hypothetical protein
MCNWARMMHASMRMGKPRSSGPAVSWRVDAAQFSAPRAPAMATQMKGRVLHHPFDGQRAGMGLFVPAEPAA